jgi:transcriptional regulator with XRE-family HTH domain
MSLLATVLPPDRIRHPHPLKQRIRALGIKQVDLSEALFCSEAELSRWLNSRRSMPSSVERQLTEILNKLEGAGDGE